MKILRIARPEQWLLLCVLLGTGFVVFDCGRMIGFPYQIDYGEGLLLNGAMSIRNHQALYPDPFTFPVVLRVYGPIAYLVAAATISPDGDVSFTAARMLIFACAVALSLLLSRLLARATGSGWIGFSFGLMLLTLPALRFWLYLSRADMVGVVISMGGVALYLLKPRYWYWSLPFFALAVFCKYSLIAAPCAVMVHLIAKRRVKEGLQFAIALGMVCSAAFGFLQFKSNGWFAFHMFSTHPDRYSLLQFLDLTILVWFSAPGVAALAIWFVAREFRRGEYSFPSIYWVTSSVTALTAGKLGSTTNHFIEWMVAACMCAGLAYSQLMSTNPKRVMPVTGLLCATVLAGVFAQARSAAQPARELTECREVYRYVAASPSARIFSVSLGPLLAAKKPVLVSDPFVYGQLAKHGRLPNHTVEQLVNERYFDVILLEAEVDQMKVHGSDVAPDSLIDAISRNYRTVQRSNCRDARVILEPIPARK